MASQEILMTTTETIPGKHIVKVLGVVKASRVTWLRSSKAMEKVDRDLIRKAREMGANAIIGVKYQDAILEYTATGTAVVVKLGRSSQPPEECSGGAHGKLRGAVKKTVGILKDSFG